jgi:hypothetical protein
MAAEHERDGLVIMRAAVVVDRYTPREFFRSQTAPSSSKSSADSPTNVRRLHACFAE